METTSKKSTIPTTKGKFFPMQLYDMLEQLDHEDNNDIVSWQPHGRAFRVHDPVKFVKTVMPRWFHQTKYTSFQRQLNIYGFIRIIHGKDTNAYYHPNFQRGTYDPKVSTIQRKPIKQMNIRNLEQVPTPSEPNFYTMSTNASNDMNQECERRTCLQQALLKSYIRDQMVTFPSSNTDDNTGTLIGTNFQSSLSNVLIPSLICNSIGGNHHHMISFLSNGSNRDMNQYLSSFIMNDTNAIISHTNSNGTVLPFPSLASLPYVHQQHDDDILWKVRFLQRLRDSALYN